MRTIGARTLSAWVITLLAVVAVPFEARSADGGEPGPAIADQSSEEPELEAPAPLPQGGVRRRLPIVIPPAEKVLEVLKRQSRYRRVSLERKPEPDTIPVERPVKATASIDLPERGCRRAIPTRQEFLNLLKTNRAEAHQILRECNLDVRTISPLPQLPVSTRQLPEDTRQRPVGTWGR